jgi:hypothetical protein
MTTPNSDTAVTPKPAVTPVPYAELLAIVQEFKLPTEEKKSGWLKVMALKGPSRVYLPINKTGIVRQVDLAELPVSEGFGTIAPKKKNGRVNGHLDQSLSKEDILSNFRALCMILAGQS